MQEYLIASSHSSAVASAEHTGKGLLHLVFFFHNNSRTRGPLLWSIATKHSVLCYWWFWRPFRKKIETALLKTRNMRPDYRGRVNWNMHSVVVQCLYLPTSMLLLTLAMMGALGPLVVFRIQLPKWVLKNSLWNFQYLSRQQLCTCWQNTRSEATLGQL